MSDIRIQRPTKGAVEISLSYDEAEVLVRAVGMVNGGSLRGVAPGLLRIVEELVQEFGRNVPEESRRYLAHIDRNQVYIEDIEV